MKTLLSVVVLALVTSLSGVNCAYSYTECSDIGLESGGLPDKNLWASSAMNSDSYPSNARLNNNKAWIADDKEPWLQVELNQKRYITAIATQGFRGSFVSLYYLSYSMNRTHWKVYTVQGRRKLFQANTDDHGIKRVNLSRPVLTKYVRLHPINCGGNRNWCAMRLELYGCLSKKKDVDECKSPDLNKCHERATCINNIGSYHCTCLDGYFGNGTYCQDVDECQRPDLNKCHEKATCINNIGSYNCTCLDGYFGNGTRCQDVDECQRPELNECHEKANCSNTLGSYNCTCLNGYFGNGTLCQDVDECQSPELNECHEKASCSNTLGSYNCTCLDGYFGNGTLCQVIDECQRLGLNKCHEKANCSNSLGSYNCTCLNGYFGNGTLCQDVDECQRFDLNKCHEKAECANNIGSYNCTCLDGYSGNGTHCQDVDECQSPELNECHEKANCSNTLGSYNCTCLDGYVGSGTRCQAKKMDLAPPSIYHVDPPQATGIKENVTLTCQASGFPVPKFTWITPDGHFLNATRSVYESFDGESQATRWKKIQQDGSLLVVNTDVHDQGIYKCVAINALGKVEKEVNLTVRKGLRLVEVDAAITLVNEVFSKELENKSSIRYKAMETKVKKELTELFRNITGFLRVDILGFFNGSVKTRFRVVVQVDHSEGVKPTVIVKKVGQTLTVGVKDGKIGSLKVKHVTLREPPPPPVNLTSRHVQQTEAFISWSFPELYEMYAITGFLVEYKNIATNKWRQFNITRKESHSITNLEEDTAYLVQLRSTNEFGTGILSEILGLRTSALGKKEDPVFYAVIALAVVVPSLILVSIVAFIYKRWIKKERSHGAEILEEQLPMNVIFKGKRSQSEVTGERIMTFAGNGYHGYIPLSGGKLTADSTEASFPWREIPRDRVTLGKVLGEGEFGMVMKGELSEDDGRNMPCAVKKLKSAAIESDYKDLLNELEIMASVGNHPNLVNLIGACSVGGPLMILVEFAEHGNLLHYLRARRKQNYEDMNEYTLEISSAERLRIACEVSDGMKHLGKMRCTHRDLAARNVLLGEGLVAKVSDFGLARDIYTDNSYEKTSAGGKLPVRWMAVESIEQGIYTSQSDVWSFGVLLWEIETGGCVPYAGVNMKELLSNLRGGHHLEKPRYCTVGLYTVMLRCWDANPKTRPTFDELGDELREMRAKFTEYLDPLDCGVEQSDVDEPVED